MLAPKVYLEVLIVLALSQCSVGIKCYGCKEESCWMLSANKGTHNLQYASADERKDCPTAQLCIKLRFTDPFESHADPFYIFECLFNPEYPTCDSITKVWTTTFGRSVKCHACATDYCNNETLGTEENPGLPGDAKSAGPHVHPETSLLILIPMLILSTANIHLSTIIRGAVVQKWLPNNFFGHSHLYDALYWINASALFLYSKVAFC